MSLPMSPSEIFGAEMHTCPVCDRPTDTSWCGRKDCDIIAAMEEGVFDMGVEVFFKEWDNDTFLSVKVAMATSPNKWWVPAHLRWGMSVRNMLRKNGFLDTHSPSGNLDDIYVQLIEAAVKKWANDIT